MTTPFQVDYQTHPAAYKHIQLSFDGDIATLRKARIVQRLHACMGLARLVLFNHQRPEHACQTPIPVSFPPQLSAKCGPCRPNHGHLATETQGPKG